MEKYVVALLLVLSGCAASNWTKKSATSADLEMDYDDCRKIATADGPGIAAAFGALGVLAGSSAADERTRECMKQRGWTRS